MTHRVERFKTALAQKQAVKAIAGIANFDLENILAVARAAEATGTDALDVAARADIIAAVRLAAPSTFVFASSVKPEELLAAVAAGADGVELGNFDALYKEGLFYTYDDVLALAEETVALVRQNPASKTLISITIPGHLSTDAQVVLAHKLEALGVDIIQTEGATRLLAAKQVKPLSAAEKAETTFANTALLVSATRLPVMTASGLDANNVSRAFAHGASAVGIGSAINTLTRQSDMTRVLASIVAQARSVHSALQQQVSAAGY